MAESQAVCNGLTFVEKRATIMLGISLGNSYFHKVENLQKMLQFAKTNSDKIMTILPEEIFEHNYRAIGSKNPRRSTKQQANNIRNKFQEAIQACGLKNDSLVCVNWASDVETSPAYIKALNYITHLYKVNVAFHTDIRESTELALVSLRKVRPTSLPNKEVPIDFEEGVLYALKELAFFSAVPEIYESCEQYVYIYHKRWGWLEKFFDGEYDGIVRPYFGFCILE